MAKFNKELVFGLYDDETDLLSAVRHANKDHMDIYDVWTPFPVHGLDPHDRITDDKFCLAFDTSHVSEGDAKSFFESTGASLVDKKNI